MSLMVKFGQTLIFKENIQNLSDESKKTDWTENKIYKSATCVAVKSKFDLNKNKEFPNKDEAVQSLVGKLKTNKEILDKISNIFFRDEAQKQNVFELNSNHKSIDHKFLDFKKDLLTDYLDDRSLSKKRNLVILTKSMTNFKNINYTDLEETNKIDSEELSKYKSSKFLNIIKKYKFDFLLSEEYKSLNAIEKNNFRKFLESEQKKLSPNKINSGNDNGVHNINDFYFDFTNKSNVNSMNKQLNNPMHPVDNFNLLSNPQPSQLSNQNLIQPISLDIKQADSSDHSDLMVSRLVLFEDFRHLVANYSLSDDQIMKYFQHHEDIKKAVEMYFKQVYGTNSLRVTFMMPDSNKSMQQHSRDFSFIESPEELFMFVYSIFPDANDPKLFKKDGIEIKIDPVNDKFIGRLKLQQNSILNVKF